MKVVATTSSTASGKPEILAWDTEFFGVKIARAFGPDDLTEWAVENTVGLMCLLIDTDRPDEIQAAEERGYRTMDIRVTLSRPTAPMAGRVRMHRPEDIERLVEIARYSHRITRFYADPTFDNDRCDDLYESWIRQSCSGWADRVLVNILNGEAAGYITVHLNRDESSIGLIAVSKEARNRGFGKELVQGAIDFAHANGATEMTVVTQGRNIDAQRLFQSCGFRTTKTEVWLHKSFGGRA